MKYPAEPLTKAEFDRLLAQCSTKCPTGLRNRALLTVMYRAGLRCGEALALLPKDCEDQQLRVLHGKGDKSRVVGLDAGAWAILTLWLERRKKLIGVNSTDPVFCTLEGARLHSCYVRELCRRLGKKAGIEKRVHPHGLRHSFACQFLEEGAPLHLLCTAMGHASVATTNTYVNHIKNPQAVAAMQAREWEPPGKRRSVKLFHTSDRKAELLRLREEIDRALANV